MYESISDNTGVKGLLSELLENRRARFNYVDRAKQGAVKKSGKLLFILNSLGGCLGIPVLFYIAFHGLRIYLTRVASATVLLSALFLAVALSLFVDVLIGYLFDKIQKAELYPVKVAFSILGMVGMVVSMAFLYNYDETPEDALSHYRWTILVIALCYTLANINTFKNTANFTPSQEDRTKLMYADHIIKAFFILFFVCVPYWAKFWTDACTCGGTCSADPAADECLTCLNNCDAFPSSLVFRNISIAFTCFFAVMSIIAEFLVSPRADEELEQIPTSFNRRISELTRNKLFVRSFWVTFFQYVILFGFAFWVNYYLEDRSPPNPTCTDFWGSASYLCTKSWMKTFTFLFFVIFTFITYFYANYKNALRAHTAVVLILLLVAGILEIIIGSYEGVIYFFIAIFMGAFYSLIPAADVLYTNGMFYDEYMAGSSQPYLTSALYHFATKSGFFVALAFHATLFRAMGTNAETPSNINSDGFGALSIFCAIVVFVIVLTINKYDIHTFDKVQVAIERNLSDTVDTVAFYDPIEKKAIRRPIVSHDSFERNVINLLYNLDPRDDLKMAINGKYEQLQSNAFVRIILFLILLAGFTTIVIVFGRFLDSRWGWFLLIALILLPISFYGILYNYNVWATAGALDSPKYKSAEKSLLLKFVPLVEDTKRSK